MHLIFSKSFSKDIDKIQHLAKAKRELKDLLNKLQGAPSLTELEHVRKLQGYENYYRIRLGDYRLGIKVTEDQIEVIRFLHRKDIYRRFP